MKLPRLEQIRLYADDPKKAATFYATIGYEVVGPFDPKDPGGPYPVYVIQGRGPELAVFQRTGSNDKTILWFLVENPRQVRRDLVNMGFVEDENYRIVTDPCGEAIGLESSAMDVMSSFARMEQWKPLGPMLYQEDDFVKYEGKIYKCIQEHQANKDDPPPTQPEHWQMVSV